MAKHNDRGSSRQDHHRAAELHDAAAHAHRSAAATHEKQDHRTGNELTRLALEHSQLAHKHTEEAHRSHKENGAVGVNHENIAALAHSLWESRGAPDGSPELDWNQASQQLRGTSSGKP